MFHWLKANRTKLTGALLVVIGALQANMTFMQTLLTPNQFAWFMVAAGCVVALLGFLNNPKPTDSDDGEP